MIHGNPMFSLERVAASVDAQLKTLSKAGDYSMACGCIGPQNGQPLCPCQMRGVQVKDGRYARIQDLGPVRVNGGGSGC